MTPPTPVCSHCNYSRAGLADSAPCPECGRAFVPATGLAAQPRRVRWCWLIGGVLLAVLPLIFWANVVHMRAYFMARLSIDSINAPNRLNLEYFAAHYGAAAILILFVASLALLCAPMLSLRSYQRALNLGAFALVLLTLLAFIATHIIQLLMDMAGPARWPEFKGWFELSRVWSDSKISQFSCACASVWIFFAALHLRSRVLCWCAGIMMAGMVIDFVATVSVMITGDKQLLRMGWWRVVRTIVEWPTTISMPATGLTCAWLAWRALGRREPFGVIWAFLKRNLS